MLLTVFVIFKTYASLSFKFCKAAGIPAGIICGLKHNSWIDIFIRTFSFLGFSIPRYWLAILIVIFFSLNLNLIPPAGYVPFTENYLKK